MPEISIACRIANRLGEGPMWHVAERALYWIDALAPALHRLDQSGRLDSWSVPSLIGSFVFRRQGGSIVAALKTGFAMVDLLTGRVDPIVAPERERPRNVLNDGKCDRRGRYWCGSRAGDLVSPAAALFRLDPDGRCHRMDDGFAVSNGIAWSPDDRTLYFADTPTDMVFAYDFDLESGSIRDRRLFASTAGLAGQPDGATVDADGCYWCALFGGGAIARFDPKGRLVSTIPLPVKNPTMCTFGGDRLDTLFVTSARALMSTEELAAQPLAGSVLAITGLGVCGLPEVPFAA